MIFLIIMLPLYSAQVLAAPNVKVTKNQGEDGINQYIDANSDTWTVEALISNLPAGSPVNPEDLKVQVGTNQRPFQSCQEDISGLLCSYVSPLSDGITEGEYKFQILYNYLEQGLPAQVLSTVNTIKADGSAPDVVINNFAQDESGKVYLDFRINENPAFAVGLSEAKILDAESGSVLKILNSFTQDLTQTFSEELTGSFSGEGWRKVKVQATDRLGHSAVSGTISGFIDVVAPKISSTMNLTTFGEYIPPFPKRTDIIIDIEESTPLVSISAASENAEISSVIPVCNGIGGNLLRCIWSNVLVQPVSPVVIKVAAKDSKGNTAEQDVHSVDLQSDTQAPQIVGFGSTGKYLDSYYVNNEQNTIILEVSDQGSGVDLGSISANLGSLGGSQTASPDECELLDNGNYLCLWKTSGRIGSNGDTLRISLNDLKDIAGNQADLPDISLIVDATKSVVEKLSAFGISEIGAKDYFQSGDLLQITATIKEKTGFKFKINVNDLISGPSAAYPEAENNQAGWVTFSNEVCDEVEPETWDCSFVVEKPLLAKTNAEISFQLVDSAGNLADSWVAGSNLKLSSASSGLYHFDILGVSEEGQYWSVGKSDVKQTLNFIDLDTVGLTYTRMPLQITFRAANPSARMLRLQALDCSPAEGQDDAPEVSRTLFYGGSFPAGKEGPVTTNLILEFSPLDDISSIVGSKESFTSKDFSYVCRFNVYSRAGKEAIRIPEVEEVPVTVNFAYSSLGSVDENLAKKITEIRENDFYEFADAMRYVTEALDWIKYISSILNVVNSVLQIFDIFSSATVAAANVAEDSVITSSAGTVLRGTCLAVQEGETTSLEFIETIQTIIQVLNCNPNIADKGVSDVLGWYGAWQQTVLDVYNGATGGIIGMPQSTSLYDNIYVSSIGLCVPGILYNLQKLQEIHCRKIICYGREVPQGIATVESCDQLYDSQVCQYVTGPVFELTPLNFGSLLSDLIKKIFEDPVGLLISAASALACDTFCYDKATGGTGLWVCKTVTVIDKLFDIINTIASAVKATPSVTGSPYCSIADKIKVSDLTQQAPEATASSTTVNDPRADSEPATNLG